MPHVFVSAGLAASLLRQQLHLDLRADLMVGRLNTEKKSDSRRVRALLILLP